MSRFFVAGLLLASLSVWPIGALQGDQSDDVAARLLAESDTQGGLVVHLGCGEGRLTAALRANDRYLVHGLDEDPHRVAAARQFIQSQGLYGQVSVDHLQGTQLPYVDNFANLVVAEKLGQIPPAEVMRVLVPDGVAMTWVDGRWVQTVKRRTEQIDEWNHCSHGSDNNAVAADLVVGPPRHLQWICGPRWSKHHEVYPPTIPVLVTAAGRLFYFEETSPPSVFNIKTRWWLVARDAFNGALLWRREAIDWAPSAWPGDLGGGLSGGPTDYRRRLVAVGDRVYVTLGAQAPIVEIDGATGQTLQTYAGTGSVFTEIIHADGSLFVSQLTDRRSEYLVQRLDAATGRQLWQAAGGHGIAVDRGRVLFISGAQVGALDAASGKRQWLASPLGGLDKSLADSGRGKQPRFNLQGPLCCGEGIVLVCPGSRGGVAALALDDGRLLWTFQNRGFRSLFRPVSAWIIDGLVWVTDEGQPEGAVDDDYLAVGLDPQTGQVRKRVPCGAVWNCGHHQRCYPSKATSRFLIFSRRGAEFLGLDDGQVGLNNWTRGACGYGVMPANGLLYSPPHSCRCYSEAALRGLTALAPASRGPDLAAPAPDAPRLQRGPAYDLQLDSGAAADPADWPTYRHDSARSGSSSTDVAVDLQQRWQVDFGGRITQPVVAAGRLLLAAIDSHTVHALDAATGKRLWTYTTGGRIDTPPTIYRGVALVGSADGWVYCLHVRDGQLAWRFRASPHDIRMGSEGQLESVWPVHGSVLVEKDIAYFAAGRGSFVDGGIWIYGLDVATGQKRYQHHYEGPDTGAGFTRENPGRGFVMPGALPDVLVSDGQRVFMRHLAFDYELKQATDMEPNFYPAPVRSGEEFGGDHKYWCDLMEVGLRAFVGRPEWDFRSFFNNFPGQRLYSTTGMLDDSWHVRSYWSYGQIVGQYLVFQDDRGYAVQAYPNAARWANYQAGDGYVLYGGRTAMPSPGQRLYALKAEERTWQVKLPLRPVALVLSGETLFVAGPPDSADPVEALAAIEGQRGAILRAVSTADGKTLAQLTLDAVPRFDGLIAAEKRLLIATPQGQLICLE